MDRKPLRITKAVLLCLALAAVGTPAAAAEPRSLGDIDPLIAAAVQTAERAAVTPDDRPFNRGASSPSLSPDDRSLFRGAATLQATSPAVHSTSDSPTLRWDASVGVATTLGIALLLAAGVFAVRHQRRRLTTF